MCRLPAGVWPFIRVPRHLAEDIGREAFAQEQLEKFVLQEIAAGRPLPGTYPPDEATRARYEEWRKNHK
jgi:hypothetical protein